MITFFWSDYSDWLPAWIKITSFVILLAYILLGIALYPRAKKEVENFSISLLEDAVIFPAGNGLGKIPYADITILNTKTKHEEIYSISIRTRSGGKIKLKGLDNMTELYKGLIEHGVKLKK